MRILSKPIVLVVILAIAFSLAVVLPFLISGKTLYGIDSNMGITKNVSEKMWRLMNERWYSNYLLGLPAGISFNLSVFLGKIIGYDKVPLFDIALYILVSFVGMYVFLRSSGLTLWGSLFGATGISLTTMGILSVLGGHINGSLGFLLLALGTVKYLYSKKPNLTRTLLLVIIAGVSLGIAFADFQRTIYFGLVLGAYIIFLTLTEFGKASKILSNRKTLARVILIPLAIFIAFLAFSINSILGMFGFVQMEQVGVTKNDPSAKWQFLTQFSYPPEEILNFFVPGVFGYFSNDPNLPYWGRAAQDFEYEKTKQGMRNFRLGIDAYTGVFVLPFILLTILYYKEWEKNRKRHFIFWGIVAIIAFLFSIARYFPPPFWLLSQIPFFDKLRVPAKWMDIFIISLVIMSAFSFDSFVKNLGKRTKENSTFLKLLFCYSGVLLVVYIILSGIQPDMTMLFVSAGYDYSISQKIAKNISSSVGTTLLFVFLGVVILHILELISGKGIKVEENWVFGKSIAGDLVLLAFIIVVFVNMFVVVKPMFKPVDAKKLYSENEIVRFMKEKVRSEQTRVAMYSALANHYFTFLFPYHNLETIQTIAQSRLPEEYNRLLPLISSFNFDIMAKYGTKYFITELPPTHPALLQIPILRYYTNLSTTLYVSEEQPSTPHSVYVYEITNSLPRFFICPNYIKYDGQLEMVLVLPLDVLRNSVLITNDIPNFIPSQNLQHTISVLEYSSEYAKLKVSVNDKCFLVFNTYYHPKWKCFVNGEERKIMKANYLVQSILLEGGEHIVEFKFSSTSPFSAVQLIMLIGFLTSLILFPLSRE